MIKIWIEYKIIYKYDKIINYLWLDEYWISEGLIDWNDIKYIEITKENIWILDYLKSYIENN